MTKLEQVARALWEQYATTTRKWEEAKPYERKKLLADARAAVEALRDPGEAAMQAGVADYLSQERHDFKRSPWNGRRMFDAMMNAILSEKPE
jgi:hypothetical protein